MSERVTRRVSDRVAFIILVALGVFAAWQLTYHLVFMELLPIRSMVGSHLISLVAETVGAAAVTIFFVRALAERNRRLEELDRQKQVLVDALVHDLRQPLTAVIGGLSALADRGDVTGDTKTLIGIAADGSEWLLRMVSDLLDIARLEAGQPLIEPHPVAASEFVQRAVQVMGPLAAEKNLNLTISLPAELPSVLGDSERLGRVTMNLLGNAVKFTDPGGSITVAARPDAERRFVLVSVQDTGMGIPPEFHQRIFGRFARVDPAAHTGRTSTGLGLYFCKLMVEAHGGRIWVESQPGKGATFTFSLPIADRPADGVARSAAPTATAARRA